MILSLILGSFFHLTAEQLQGLQECGVQPDNDIQPLHRKKCLDAPLKCAEYIQKNNLHKLSKR